jgi:hypothetical protein
MKVENDIRGREFAEIRMLDYAPAAARAIRKRDRKPMTKTPEEWAAWRLRRKAAAFERWLTEHYGAHERRMSEIRMREEL